MVLIYQPPNAHVWILLRNAMAAAAVKKIYTMWSNEAIGTDCAEARKNHLFFSDDI
jgi:hypothetical protein